MKRTLFLIVLTALAVITPRSANASELITNGGFETGNFTGWTTVNSTGFWLPWQVTLAGAGGTFNPPFVTAPQEGTRDAWQGTATTTPNSPFTMDQTITIPAASTASIIWKQRFQVNLVDFCSTVAQCGNVVYSVQVLNTSNTVLQTLWTVTAPALTKTDTGWQTVQKLLTPFAGQTIKIRFMTNASALLGGPGQLEIDAVSVQTPAVVTASNASVMGRLSDSDGRPISGASVSLSDGSGGIRYAQTNPFGYYRFDQVATGFTYVVNATDKRYFFPDSPRAITVDGDLNNLDFQASP